VYNRRINRRYIEGGVIHTRNNEFDPGFYIAREEREREREREREKTCTFVQRLNDCWKDRIFEALYI